MPQPPRYPDRSGDNDPSLAMGGDQGSEGAEGDSPRRLRRTYLVWAAVIAIVVAMILLHVFGVVGPGTN